MGGWFQTIKSFSGLRWRATGSRGWAYANGITALIHHPVTSKVIKSNYRRPLRTHLNLPPDGDPAEQQVASLHADLRPTAAIWVPGDNGGLKEPDIRVKNETDV